MPLLLPARPQSIKKETLLQEGNATLGYDGKKETLLLAGGMEEVCI
jgi:hypothetical protein